MRFRLHTLAFREHYTGLDRASMLVSETWLSIKRELKIHDLDLLIVVSSLPYPEKAFSGYDLAASACLSTRRVIEFGSDCTTVLDALLYAAFSVERGSRAVMIVVYDDFPALIDKITLRQKPDCNEWRSGLSITVLSNSPNPNYKVISLRSIVDTRFSDMIKISNTKGHHALRFNSDSNFIDIDLCNDTYLIDQDIKESPNNITSLIMTNRNNKRYSSLMNIINNHPSRIFYSRTDIGHTGGSDIIYNLMSCTSHSIHAGDRLILSGNGLGYTWKTLTLEGL